jgi:two-component system, response regulator PdtaR
MNMLMLLSPPAAPAQLSDAGFGGSGIYATTAPASEAYNGLHRPHRILILEDEPLIALELQLLVEDMGHEICAVTDTEVAAVRIATAEGPDLIIADIHLRQGNGVAAARTITSVHPIPVIFVSANQSLEPHPSLPSARFLSKPFRVETLQQAIRDSLAGAH